MALLGGGIAAALPAVPALAGDYYHVCRTADGSYEMNDEALYRVDGGSEPAAQIPYRKLSEKTLQHETGYCVVKSAGGQRYNHESRTYTVRAAFTDDGRDMEADFICELASDGLPAAYSCDQRVVTSSTSGPDAGAPTTAPSGPSLWLHNGSVMRLTARGAKRTFTYDAPRSGMVRAGARRGTVLFEGTRDGDIYSGIAYIFAKGCPPAPYGVAGEVSGGERRITLTGDAPRLDRSCRITGTRPDTLVFTFKPATD